jgi:hypothetical protein
MTVPEFTNNEEIFNISYQSGNNVTLYAIWDRPICVADNIATEGRITYGDSYICQLGGIDRKFYIVSYNATTVSLILDNNLVSNVAWSSNSLNTTNAENIKSVLSSNTSAWENVLVRLPLAAELAIASNIFDFDATGDDLTTVLNDFLTENIGNGYWTETLSTNENWAWLVNDSGNLVQNGVALNAYALRPVIELGKSDVEGLEGMKMTDGVYVDDELNGADPVLKSGMIPIVIDDNGNVTRANLRSAWYDYQNKIWANAILGDEVARSTAPGMPIDESHILAYFVWIPRYEYNLSDMGAGKDTTITRVNFVPASELEATDGYIIHPAFTNLGNRGFGELAGIWVGKFETGNTNTAPQIKPNIETIRNINVKTMFESAELFNNSTLYGLAETADAHMMKNSEWGAVAYLSHSAYGKGAAEIWINNCSSFVTGIAGNSASDASSSSTCTNEANKWNGNIGQNASTNGNMTGIYDMSGSAYEYVMGYNIEATLGGESGFGTSLPNQKYYDIYNNNSSAYYLTSLAESAYCFTISCKGHALYETYISSSDTMWFSDKAYIVDLIYPWVLRGGDHTYGVNAGIFHANTQTGIGRGDFAFRTVIPG